MPSVEKCPSPAKNRLTALWNWKSLSPSRVPNAASPDRMLSLYHLRHHHCQFSCPTYNFRQVDLGELSNHSNSLTRSTSFLWRPSFGLEAAPSPSGSGATLTPLKELSIPKFVRTKRPTSQTGQFLPQSLALLRLRGQKGINMACGGYTKDTHVSNIWILIPILNKNNTI